MKRRMSFLILFFVFLFFQIDVQAATFRTCTYEGDSHSATLTIEQSGSFSLKVDNDSIKGKNTDVSNTLTGKKINEQGCPTWIVNGGKKYYFYYSESRKNSREADLGDDYGYTLTKKSDTIKDVSKSSYDSKCTYNFKYGDKDVDMTYYIYENDFIYATIEDGKSMDNNINGGQTLSDGSYMITSQYFKNYDKDASVECPQIKACAQGTTIELYSGTDYTCSGSEISVTTNGREYGSDYTGPTVDQNEKTTCTTSLKFNSNLGSDLKGQVVKLTLSKYANGKRCLSFNGSEKCVEATELPQISQTYKTRNFTILFQDETEADKIYQKAFQSDGTCGGFNIKQANNNSDIVLTLTTQAVDSSESAVTIGPDQTIYDEDFDVLYDDTWDPEEGCLLLQNSTVIKYLRRILDYLRLAAAVLLLLLGSLDFAGAVMSEKKDAMKTAISKFIKRLLSFILIFLLPFLINILLFIANKSESVCNLFDDSTSVSSGSTSDGSSSSGSSSGTDEEKKFTGKCKYKLLKSDGKVTSITLPVQNGVLNFSKETFKLDGITYSVVYKGKTSAFEKKCPSYLYAKIGNVKNKKATITITDTKLEGYQSISKSNTNLSLDGNSSSLGKGKGKVVDFKVKYNVKDSSGKCGRASGDYCAAIATLTYEDGTKQKFYMGYQNNYGMINGPCLTHAVTSSINAIKGTNLSSLDVQNYQYNGGGGGKLVAKNLSKVISHYGVTAKVYTGEYDDATVEQMIRTALNNGQPVILFVKSTTCPDLAGTAHAQLALYLDENDEIWAIDSVNYTRGSGGNTGRTPKEMVKCLTKRTGAYSAKKWGQMVIFSFD